MSYKIFCFAVVTIALSGSIKSFNVSKGLDKGIATGNKDRLETYYSNSSKCCNVLKVFVLFFVLFEGKSPKSLNLILAFTKKRICM